MVVHVVKRSSEEFGPFVIMLSFAWGIQRLYPKRSTASMFASVETYRCFLSVAWLEIFQEIRTWNVWEINYTYVYILDNHHQHLSPWRGRKLFFFFLNSQQCSLASPHKEQLFYKPQIRIWWGWDVAGSGCSRIVNVMSGFYPAKALKGWVQ